MKSILIAAAALIAMPAAAQAVSDTESSGGTAAVAASSVAAPATIDNKRYCIFQDVTSSRLPRKVCKSRADWLAEGVDVTRTR